MSLTKRHDYQSRLHVEPRWNCPLLNALGMRLDGDNGINENELSRVEELVRVKNKERKVVDAASLLRPRCQIHKNRVIGKGHFGLPLSLENLKLRSFQRRSGRRRGIG
jgi:hypothetical protein